MYVPWSVHRTRRAAWDSRSGLPTAEGFWVGMGAREMSDGVGGGLLYCERSRASLGGAKMN